MSRTWDREQFIPSSPSEDPNPRTPVVLPIRSHTGTLPSVQHARQTTVEEYKRKKKICRVIGGLACIFICVATWVIMAEFLQRIESGYHQAYFIRYVVNGSYMICIIPHLIMKFSRERRGRRLQSYFSVRGSSEAEHDTPLWRRLLIPGIVGAGGSILGGWTWYVSLRYTVAAVNSTLYQSQVVFAFLFSICVLGEKVRYRKIIAVFVALGGVAMISFGKTGTSKTSHSHTTMGGILMTIGSAAIFALYEVLIKYFGKKHFNPEHKVEDTLLLQTFIGIMGLLTAWPLFLLFDHVGLEKFVMPTTIQWIPIFITCAMDTIYTSAFLLGITLIGPVAVALGQLMTIPATFLADFALGKIHSVSLMAVIGCLLVVIGFIAMEVKIPCPMCAKIQKGTEVEASISERAEVEKHPYHSGFDSGFGLSYSDSD